MTVYLILDEFKFCQLRQFPSTSTVIVSPEFIVITKYYTTKNFFVNPFPRFLSYFYQYLLNFPSSRQNTHCTRTNGYAKHLPLNKNKQVRRNTHTCARINDSESHHPPRCHLERRGSKLPQVETRRARVAKPERISQDR